MAQAVVTIAGRTYRMNCDEGEEAHIESLARLVEAKIADLARRVWRDRRPAHCRHGRADHRRRIIRGAEAGWPNRPRRLRRRATRRSA